MAGHERRRRPNAAPAGGWALTRSAAALPVPAGGPSRDLDRGESVPVPIARTDGYALWAAGNGFRRIGHIRPADAAQPPPTHIPDCSPPRFRVPRQYVLVLIQVATGLPGDEGADAARRQRLDAQQRISHGGLRVRRAFRRFDATSRCFVLDDSVRFVTALVADWWWPCFLQRMTEDAVRWEIGHARLPMQWHPPTPVTTERNVGAWRDSPAWDARDERLGDDVMVIIDQGCPFAHEQFRSDTGMGSRVRYLWLQGAEALRRPGDLPRPMFHGTSLSLFPYGHELRGSRIDALMAQHRRQNRVDEAACYAAIGYEGMLERSSHGGHVMSVACGHPNPLAEAPGEDWLRGRCRAQPGAHVPLEAEAEGDGDAAGRASIIFIELPRDAVADSSGGAMNVLLVDALNYVLHRTTPDARITVNCSYGTHGGPHDRSSLLEQAIDEVLSRARRQGGQMTLVVPIGNAYQSACHAFQTLRAGDTALVATVDVPADKRTDTFIEAWYPRTVTQAGRERRIDVADLELTLTRPDGQALHLPPGSAVTTWTAPASGAAPSVTVVQTDSATDTRHRILVVLAPTWQPAGCEAEGLAPYGHWTLQLRSRREDVAMPVDVWIERDDPIYEPRSDRQAHFFIKPPEDPADQYPAGPVTRSATFTSYATGAQVLAVGGFVRARRRDDRFTDDGQAPVLASYSSAGPSMPHLPAGKPDALAAVDDGAELQGRLAAGNLSAGWVRRNGTSVAAPQLARWVLNSRDPTLAALPAFMPALAGEHGDGLSLEGDLLQIIDRTGLGLRVPD